MSADRLHFMGSFHDPEPEVELMDDDSSSNDSDDDMKSVNSEQDAVKDDDMNSRSNSFNGIHNDIINNNTELLHVNGKKVEDGEFDQTKPTTFQEELTSEDAERKRFQIELEFVQSLANPNYLNFLAQRGYFKNQTFLNYLKYLMYWKKPEYVTYIRYPQCLSLLELLQHEQFLKEILNAQCSKWIDEQLLLVWIHYFNKKRDWIRCTPDKIPDDIEKLFLKTENSIVKKTEKIMQESPELPNPDPNNPVTQPEKQSTELEETTDVLVDDSFAASQFLANEKF